MSGFGGFGGFGSNNQQQQNTGFGGFGQNNNNSGGFGTSNTGFGANNNTTGGGFGSTGGGFGSTSGGFGTNNNTSSPFGAKPAFGSNAPASGGLFGANNTNNNATSSSGFGGFGSNNNQPQQTSGFGSSNTTTGLFGANKPAFGTATPSTGGGGIFGSGSGFGSNNTSTGFGASATGASTFGAGASMSAQNNGSDVVPFQPFNEKDGGPSGQTVSYQSISTMDQYKNFSPEELRVADYNKGKRYGNANGQAGAFGQSTGFGGFGGTSNNQTTTGGFGSAAPAGGLFGNNTNTQTSGFGQQNPAGSSFGGGLFGANKPATTGGFGTTTTPASTQGGTGLFGSTGNTGFGGTTTNTAAGFGATGGGGVFGQNNQNQAQNKPFGGFGSNNTTNAFGGATNTTNTGFGQTAPATGTSLFGQPNAAAGTGFGANNQQSTPSTFGSFGQNNQNQNNQQPASGMYGGFGNNHNNSQQKSLFGGSTAVGTSTGLFGQPNNQQQQAASNPFGGNTNNQQQGSTGLFGAKPAATGGIFGASQPAASANTGVFGGLNTQTQQNQTNSLFGQSNQNQAKPLFGATNTNNSAGGGLFGNLGQNQNQQQSSGLGNSLFGNTQQQQQPQMSNSLFNSQNQQNRPQGLVASLDNLPYGNEQLFAHLENPPQSVGPIATPLSSSQRAKKQAILPQHKLNPAASSRLITPQKRPPTGFGFSYSSYGTPGSAVSNASPGSFASNLLGGSSFGRSLGKSFSTSNLRGTYNSNENGILTPGAFAASPRSFAPGGSLKRLQINRNINTSHSLFTTTESNSALAPSPLKKTVSFDATAGGDSAEPSSSRALVRTEGDDASHVLNGNGTSKPNGAPSTNGEQSNGKTLASVPEHTFSSSQSVKPNALESTNDKELGDYYAIPTLDEIRGWGREQLKHVKNFTVGRTNGGKIVYSEADLSQTPLDKIFDGIVKIGLRSAATYATDDPVKKPPRGSGMNVPATITLENSWPRAKGGKLPVHETRGSRFDKHIARLKRVPDTHFVDYNAHSGVWTFSVDHFTVYGMDYDGEPGHDESFETSVLSAPLDTPTPVARTPGKTPLSALQDDLTMLSGEDSELDDTFEFQRRKRSNLPGGFGEESEIDQDGRVGEDDTLNSTQSFLDERSVGSPQDHSFNDDIEGDELMSDRDEEMAGSFPVPAPTTELALVPAPALNASTKPKSILKASQMGRSMLGTPSKKPLEIQDSWTAQLQRTVSPKKRDRQALKESQGTVLRQKQIAFHESTKLAVDDKPFRTSMDIMNSLYGSGKDTTTARKSHYTKDGLRSQVPFAKKPKITDANDMPDKDKAFHQCNKPRWSPDGTLTYSINGNAPLLADGAVVNVNKSIVGEQKDIRFAQLVTPGNSVPETLRYQRNFSDVRLDNNSIPYAVHTAPFSFADFASRVDVATVSERHEQKVWQVASILFDNPIPDIPEDIPHPLSREHEARLRKERLSEFWQSIVQGDADSQIEEGKVPEAKALNYLSSHNIADACASLLEGRNFRLATMVAQIGGCELMRREIATQIEEWRRLNALSEMTDTVRAIYELLAGNCSICEGKSGAGGENKASTFKIASRFGFDWRRAFGLRLWYGTLPNEDIAMAVAQFESDVREGREDVKPVPWYIEKHENTGWETSDSSGLEDVLWGLLKLYAAQTKDIAVNVEEILAPANSSGNPLDARLSWQLLQLLRSRRDIKLPIQRSPAKFDSSLVSSTSSAASLQSIVAVTDPKAINDAADALTLSYGAMLEDTHAWITSTWIYAHLSEPSLRATCIQEVLAMKANDFDVPSMTPDPSPAGSQTGGSKYDILTNRLRIPVAWLHSAKALYARSVLQEPILEIQHLLAAWNFSAAHDVLCSSVGPFAIISRDYDILRELLGGFERPINKRTGARGKDAVSGGQNANARHWSVGGQIYFDFIYLLDTQLGHSRRGHVWGGEQRTVLKRLVSALAGLSKDLDEGKMGLQERAAIWEMARVTADWVQTEGALSRSEVVRLPLMEDGWLRCARESGVHYFKGMLAYAR